MQGCPPRALPQRRGREPCCHVAMTGARISRRLQESVEWDLRVSAFVVNLDPLKLERRAPLLCPRWAMPCATEMAQTRSVEEVRTFEQLFRLADLYSRSLSDRFLVYDRHSPPSSGDTRLPWEDRKVGREWRHRMGHFISNHSIETLRLSPRHLAGKYEQLDQFFDYLEVSHKFWAQTHAFDVHPGILLAKSPRNSLLRSALCTGWAQSCAAELLSIAIKG